MKEKLAATDLLPSFDELRVRLAENQAEHKTLLQLNRLAYKTYRERQRLIDLADAIFEQSSERRGA